MFQIREAPFRCGLVFFRSNELTTEGLATRRPFGDRTLSIRLGTVAAILVGAAAGFALGVSKLGGTGAVFQAFSADPAAGSEHCINGYVYRFVQRDDLPNATLELLYGGPPEGEERDPEVVYLGSPVPCEAAMIKRR